MSRNNQKKKVLLFSLVLSIIIGGIKFLAYFLTNSNAILTDAFESIINVVAGAFALFSISLAAKPKDVDHPYGHGKIEFLSVGFEGFLISFAGLAMIGKALYNFIFPQDLSYIDMGLYLAAITGFLNFMLGKYLQKKGKELQSITLEADGKHISSDAYSSVGLILGLILIYFTKIAWLDNIIAILLGIMIIVTGYKLLRKSVAGVMDEADHSTLEEIITVLNDNRKVEWIDIHNMRLIKYGSDLHIDCHVTLPWYDSLSDSHEKIKEIENLIAAGTENHVEIFIHPDPCLPSSCSICKIENCKVRKNEFRHTVEWNLENLILNEKHKSE